jgi:protein-tyrosine phosphatase
MNQLDETINYLARTWSPLFGIIDYLEISQIPLQPVLPSNYTGHLYLGPLFPSEVLLSFFREKNITVVISMGFPTKPFPDVPGIHWYGYPIEDNLQEDNAKRFENYLPEICTILDSSLSKGENVYVHCMAGISRSATVVLYFLISRFLVFSYNNKPLSLKFWHTFKTLSPSKNLLLDFVKYLKKYRKVISPNRRFLQICHDFIQKNYVYA